MDETVGQMNRSMGELMEAVKGLRRDVDKVLEYMKEHDAVLDDHEKRLCAVEGTQRRGGEIWKIAFGFVSGVLGVIVAAWLKAQLGL